MRFLAYIAASVDGFIAPADGGIEWLAPYETIDYGYDAFLAGIASVVMGRITYEQSRSFGDWPYWGKRTYVLTSQPAPAEPVPDLAFAGDAGALIADLRREAAGDVWIVGGTAVVQAFLAAGAVDELRLFLIPTLLGGGRPLFAGAPPADLALAAARAYENGVVALTYRLVG